ncbi:MAG: acetyl-CoA carboxylase carboxyl transferase subunit alpha, partial [Verrucomicrobiota bacterium]
CAAILWRLPEKAPEAATALKLTAKSALEFGLIDGIVDEPKGGAHRDPIEAFGLVKDAISGALDDLQKLKPAKIKEARYQKFRAMGRMR